MICTNYVQNIDLNEKQFSVHSDKLSIHIFLKKAYEISDYMIISEEV